MVFGEDGLGAGEVVGFQVGDGGLPEAAELDEAKAEVVGSDGAGVVEVVGDFVGDDGDFEGGCGLGAEVGGGEGEGGGGEEAAYLGLRPRLR